MLRNVYLKSLRDMRRSVVWWSLGLIAMTALMIAVYPTIRDNPDLNKLVENYPEALKAFIAFGGDLDYTSGAGYLGSELFAFMVPLLLSATREGWELQTTANNLSLLERRLAQHGEDTVWLDEIVAMLRSGARGMPGSGTES